MSKTISLTGKHGGITLVDDEWYDYLNQWKWYKSSKGYAVRSCNRINGKQKIIYMHRVINNTSIGFETDHINRNKLDNRACNLRTATHSENKMNRDLQSNNVSGYIGVCWNKTSNKWEVYFKSLYVCRCLTLEDAIAIRRALEREKEITKPLHSRNKSGYTGISWDKTAGKYIIKYKGKYIATISTFEDAIKAIQKAERGEEVTIPLNSRNTSGYTGVCWHKASNKWQVKYKDKCYGTFFILEDAILKHKEIKESICD